MSLLTDLYNKWVLKKAYKWGKSRATHKLKVFKTFREEYPSMPKRELYYLTILIGRDFTERRAQHVIEMAEGGSDSLFMNAPFIDRKFCLQNVIKTMLIVESLRLFNPLPHPEFISEAYKAVEDVIPEEL